ncbi:unnamed protein product [Callosobruchus maculatus]|uniref:Uncharacterized protein n=1 Tax=Callosobruchus maculatus TaxID=64391 RepID=A0A653CVY9_CALMS|nr:unnamed protein product [Callosobruchus maculatus]
MIVSKAKTLRKSEDAEPESILPDVPNTNDIASVFVKGNESPTPEDPPSIVVKQEIIIQPEFDPVFSALRLDVLNHWTTIQTDVCSHDRNGCGVLL